MCVCVCTLYALTVRHNWHLNNLLMNNCLPGSVFVSGYSLKLIAEHNIYIYYNYCRHYYNGFCASMCLCIRECVPARIYFMSVHSTWNGKWMTPLRTNERPTDWLKDRFDCRLIRPPRHIYTYIYGMYVCMYVLSVCSIYNTIVRYGKATTVTVMV